MENADDPNFGIGDFIENPIRMDEGLANGGVVEFRDHAPAFAKPREGFGGSQEVIQQVGCGLGRVLGDVLQHGIKVVPRRLRPDYLTRPICHFSRISSATC